MAITSFIPQVWSARLLEHLDNTLVARSFFNQDYVGEIRNYGDTVRINQISDPTITTYIPNQDMDSPEELSTVGQDLRIDQAESFNFQVDDVDAAQARSGLMDSAMQRSAFKLAEVEDTWLFGVLNSGVAPANVLPPVSVTNADMMFSVLVGLRQVLVKNNVPSNQRRVALPPEAISMLLQDDRFTATGSGQAENRLQAGLIGRAVGFEVYEVNTTPGGNTAIAGHPLAATFAGQIVQTEAFRMEKRFADGVKGLSVYGARVLVPGALASVVLNF